MNVSNKQPAKKERLRQELVHGLKNGNTALVLLIIVAMIVLSILIPNFLSVGNIFNLLTQASIIGLPAIGLTFIIVTAGIDLSLSTNMACSAILGCIIMRNTQNVLLGVLSILAVAILFGCINGFSVAKLKMVPMIVTLAIQTLNVGISNYCTQGTSIAGLPESYSRIFAGSIGNVVPISVVVFLAVAYLMHLLLTRTIFGRQLFQTGINEQAARVNGVLTAARLNSAGPTMGPASAFNNIVCSCVLGGASVWGGKGTILGTLIGSIIMAIITNAMNLMNVDFFITYIIKGLIIVLVCYLDVLRNKVTIKEH